MSNEPKWDWHIGDDYHGYVTKGDKTYWTINTRSTQHLCDTLNRLEAERQEFLNANYTLQDRFRRLESENAELRERLNTPRTDADGLNRLTNEQIDAMFPESMVERYYTQRQAARQVRDLLQGKEGERNA